MTDPDEETERAAEHKAAALHNLGWETGAGATIWSRAISDLLEQHEAVRNNLGETFGLEKWERLHSTALLLVVAVDQVLAFERRVRKLTGDAELAKARERFDYLSPDAEAIRDLVSHLDEYAIGSGRRQTGRREPPVREPYLQTHVWWTKADGGTLHGTIVSMGDEQLNLRRTAEAAIELAKVVESVRTKHLQLAEQEARAASKRRWGVQDA